MTTKLCPICKETLSADKFHKNPRRKSGLQSRCIECNKVYLKQYYNKNRQACIDKQRNNTKKKVDFILEIKNKLKCTQCGENHPACLQFHHNNPNEKEFIIGDVVRCGYSKERVLLEIAKCTVLCANCHFKLHYDKKHG